MKYLDLHYTCAINLITLPDKEIWQRPVGDTQNQKRWGGCLWDQCVASIVGFAHPKNGAMTCRSSPRPNAPWTEISASDARATNDLSAGDAITANFKSFGTCFNELVWVALQKASAADRAEVLRLMFSPQEMALSYNRLPIGANDFSTSWYSRNETAGDYAMETFSISRDHVAVIP